MISKKIKSFCAVLFLLPLTINAQDNFFDNFKTTTSIGQAPAIFTSTFDEKVAAKIESTSKISKKDKKKYAQYTNYALNSLLQSGLVLYGDPMTQLVDKVAAKLLENEPQLSKELQFYVIKSNITNALCTDPGVIFITTGLIAQIENEAQLAYVIAHEIVHYQEKHHEESFNKTKENSLNPSASYEDLVLLSKDHEFEADAKALKLYHAAGYSDKEINTVFDVLMYSYLTFDEVKIDSTFFGNPNIYIPQSYFPEKANPILAFEEYDDSKSTHPNIRRRKEAISNEVEKYNNWKDNSNFIAIEEFELAQNIARFESVRGNLLKSNYVKALYEIYILEKQFPNNEYLQTSKALAWLFMSQTNLSGRKSSFVSKVKEKEGSISMLYSFISKLSPEELVLMSVRQTQDIHQEFPASKRIKEIRDETILILAHVRKFEINRLEKISYLEALKLRDQYIDEIVEQDTTTIEGESKYDKIRRIRALQSSTESTTELIDENFSAFLLYDLASSREFYEIFEKEKEAIKVSRNPAKLSKKERRQEKKAKNKKLEGDIIVINPQLEAVHKGFLDLNKTILFYNLMEESIRKYAPKGRLQNKSHVLSEDFTTEKHNETSLINSYLYQKSNLNNGNFRDHLIDNEEMQAFLEKYNNPHLVLITGKANKSSIFRNDISGSAQYIDIASGSIIKSNYYSMSLRVRKASVGGLAYGVFSKF